MRILYILFMGLLFSCGNGGEQELLPVEDSVKQLPADTGHTKKTDSVQPVEQPIVFNDIPKTKEVNELLRYFIEKYAINFAEINPDELKVHVLDRFGCDKKYKVYLQKKIPFTDPKTKTNIFPVAEIRAYVYKDSAQCANAVNNWLNCFGNSCEMVQVNQPANLQSTPGYYILNEKNIVCLDYKEEHMHNNWKNVYADLKKLFVNWKSKVIEVKQKGELVWVQ